MQRGGGGGGGGRAAPPPPPPPPDRLQAAYRYIEQHLHLPTLTPERIA
ncbi:hypothetical protein GSH00_05470, partial [Burkholderia pseudomallei]|nr:hypothetical protein [Burkholderia pseudomallei]